MVQQLVWTPKQSAPKAFPERQALMPVWGGVPMPRPQCRTFGRKSFPMPPMWTRLLICIFHFAPTIAFFAASTVMRGRTAKAACTPTKLSKKWPLKPKFVQARAKSELFISGAVRRPRCLRKTSSAWFVPATNICRLPKTASSPSKGAWAISIWKSTGLSRSRGQPHFHRRANLQYRHPPPSRPQTQRRRGVWIFSKICASSMPVTCGPI